MTDQDRHREEAWIRRVASLGAAGMVGAYLFSVVSGRLGWRDRGRNPSARAPAGREVGNVAPVETSDTPPARERRPDSTDIVPTEVMYTQWCEDFRALQTVFWQVPFFAMTITGGIGAAVIAFGGAVEIKRVLLVFGGLCNFALIFIAWRVRRTMETLLKKIFSYEGVNKPKTGFFVLRWFAALFVLVGLTLVVSGALSPSKWLTAKDDTPAKKAAEVPSPDASRTTIIYH